LGAQDHVIAAWSTSYEGIWTQWTGVLAGPLAWSAMLGVDYALTKWSCGHATAYVLQIVAVLAILCTTGGAYAAWRTLMLVPAGVPDDPSAGPGRVVVLSRSRFMGVLGLTSSALFALLLVAESVPIWTLHGVCW
jgi:hypothetical protein